MCGTEGSIHLAAQVEPNGATGKWTAFRPVGGPEGGCTHTPGLVVGRSAQLLLFSADARLRDQDGQSPLVHAANSGSTRSVTYLLESGNADPNDTVRDSWRIELGTA